MMLQTILLKTYTEINKTLLIVFITLKSTQYIAWSWFWVFSFFWIPVVFFTLFSVIFKCEKLWK